MSSPCVNIFCHVNANKGGLGYPIWLTICRIMESPGRHLLGAMANADNAPGPAHLVTNLPDIGHLAKWSVSSYKFGFGAECLRDEDPETFWHSDGPQPHFITVQFGKKVAIQKIALHLSYLSDDSYTPATLCVRAGTGLSDLQDVRLVTFDKPNGWLLFDVYLEPTEEGDGFKPLHAYVLQVVIVSNHMNGKDTHVRGLKIFGPIDHAQMEDDDPFPFKSSLFKMYESIR